jgi:hypothetical protein
MPTVCDANRRPGYWLLTACDPTSERSLGSRSRALVPYNDPATPESERRRRPQPDGRQPGSTARYRAGSARHRKPLSTPGASGHHRRTRTAGHTAYTATTSDPETGWGRVRIPPDGCRGPAALANEAGVAEDGPHPAAKVVPSPPGPSHIHPHRPCPRRVLRIGRQRSFTDNKGRCMLPPSCPDRSIRSGPRELPKLAVSHCSWSALGPHGIRNRWSPAGTSGHARTVQITGHRRSTATTLDGRSSIG